RAIQTGHDFERAGGREPPPASGPHEHRRREAAPDRRRPRRHGELDPRNPEHHQADGRPASTDPGCGAIPASLDPAHRTRAYRRPSRPISRGGPRMSETLKTAGFMLGAIALVVAASVTQPEQRTASIFNDEGQPFYPEFRDPQSVKAIEVVDYDDSTA